MNLMNWGIHCRSASKLHTHLHTHTRECDGGGGGVGGGGVSAGVEIRSCGSEVWGWGVVSGIGAGGNVLGLEEMGGCSNLRCHQDQKTPPSPDCGTPLLL